MKNWTVDLFYLSKNLIPWFIRKGGAGLVWVTESSLSWVTASGEAWGTTGQEKHVDWIQSLVKPIQSLANRFAGYAGSIYYRLSFTGQVIYIEHYLNDNLDIQLRRIFISDNTIVLPPYLYNEADQAPDLFLYNNADGEDVFYLYNISDYFLQAEFTINVPSAIPLTLEIVARIKRLTNQLKQAGVKYNIVNY